MSTKSRTMRCKPNQVPDATVCAITASLGGLAIRFRRSAGLLRRGPAASDALEKNAEATLARFSRQNSK